ncbi:hypothetical protein B0O80DRAFT_423983 [Mortierella sp. GBAus27b]|nr:hypothetical protein B0O80DRAFT_423983 [Mortierella sp. GBAus27b]
MAINGDVHHPAAYDPCPLSQYLGAVPAERASWTWFKNHPSATANSKPKLEQAFSWTHRAASTSTPESVIGDHFRLSQVLPESTSSFSRIRVHVLLGSRSPGSPIPTCKLYGPLPYLTAFQDRGPSSRRPSMYVSMQILVVELGLKR